MAWEGEAGLPAKLQQHVGLRGEIDFCEYMANVLELEGRIEELAEAVD